MSNLIVAILGVALFTGILVYGATLTGPKIEEGRVAAAASQAYSEMALTGSAVNRFRFAREIGSGAASGEIATYVAAGYLDRVPVNPVDPARAVQLVDAAGRTVSGLVAAGGDANAFVSRFVVMSLGSDQLMCTWFARQVGALAASSSVVSTSQVALASGLSRQAGCFRTGAATGNVAVGEYMAFVRI